MKNALAVVGLVFPGSVSNTYFTEAFIVEMERRFSLLTLKFSIKKAQLSILSQFSSLCFEVTEPLLSPLPLQGLLTLVFQLTFLASSLFLIYTEQFIPTTGHHHFTHLKDQRALKHTSQSLTGI